MWRWFSWLWFWQDCNLKKIKYLKSNPKISKVLLVRTCKDDLLICGCLHIGWLVVAIIMVSFVFFCKNDGYDKRSWMGGPTTNQDPFDETKWQKLSPISVVYCLVDHTANKKTFVAPLGPHFGPSPCRLGLTVCTGKGGPHMKIRSIWAAEKKLSDQDDQLIMAGGIQGLHAGYIPMIDKS